MYQVIREVKDNYNEQTKDRQQNISNKNMRMSRGTSSLFCSCLGFECSLMLKPEEKRTLPVTFAPFFSVGVQSGLDTYSLTFNLRRRSA